MVVLLENLRFGQEAAFWMLPAAMLLCKEGEVDEEGKRNKDEAS